MRSQAENPDDPDRLEQTINARTRRRLRAQRQRDRSVFFGLGMFGLIGWSVAIPAVGGVALGLWIDSRWPTRHSWTLMLLLAGMAMGCLNAWNWVRRESREPANEPESENS